MFCFKMEDMQEYEERTPHRYFGNVSPIKLVEIEVCFLCSEQKS